MSFGGSGWVQVSDRGARAEIPVFAFRLHQFLSRGDTVYASPEQPGDRYLTLTRQRFVPGSNREKVLLPLAFCRECGQDYYVVKRQPHDDGAALSVSR